jgi:cellulose biosynthesis protein BcsS
MSLTGCRGSTMRGVLFILIALAVAVCPRRALAGTTAVEAIAGWEGDSYDQGYGFAGAGWLIPAGQKVFVPLRVFASYLYYDFESSGTITRVSSPGLSLMAGARFPGTNGNLTLLGGGESRREHRTTGSGPGTEETQTPTGIVLQADGDHVVGRCWRASLLANYGGASRYLYGRTAMRRQMTNLDWKGPTSFFLGFEAIGQGNDESEAVQGGGFAEWNLTRRHLSLAFHAGYKDRWSPGESHHRGGYLGLGFYERF